MEKPYSGRANFNETMREFIIEVPSKKNWFIIIFMTAWLGGWLMGEIFVLGFVTGIFGGNSEEGFTSLFLLFWLIAWTAGGIFVIRTLVWMIAGKEIISFSKTELKIQKKAMLFNKPKTYDMKEVKNFSLNPNSGVDNIFGNLYGTNFWNIGNQGIFKFDYGLKTIKIASGIDDAEGKYLLEKVESKNLLNK